MRDFGYLNKKIEEHILEIENRGECSTIEYLKWMRKIYQISLPLSQETNAYIKHYEEKPSVFYQKGISLEETIQLVHKFLNSIDPRLVQTFHEMVHDGILKFHTDKELKHIKVTPETFYYFYNFAATHDEQYIVHVVLKHYIADVFNIVHEFIHYVTMKTPKQKSIAWLHFTEGYAFSLEYLLFQFLKRNPKWKKEACKYYTHLLYELSLRVMTFQEEFTYFDIYEHYGMVSPQKIFKYGSNLEEIEHILKSARKTEESFSENPETLRDYLEDSRYVFSFPFSVNTLKRFPKEKEEILVELYNLETYPREYYFEQYDFEKIKSYQNLFYIEKK